MRISRRNLFQEIVIGGAVGGLSLRLNDCLQAAPSSRSNSGRHGETIRLDMNVNPYGPSPKVVEVIQSNLGLVHRYPESEYGSLIERIAAFHGVKPTQVIVGAGARDILRIAVEAYLANGKRLVLASPGFEALASLATQRGAHVRAVPIDNRYAHDLEAMLRQVHASTGLVYICNPNNPTGSLTPRKDLETFLPKLPPKVHVIIDEAYHDYVGPSSDYVSFIDRPIDDKRVIVLRTLSKIYGLAGLRLGYAISSAEVSSELSAMQSKDDVNILAARAAAAALDDSDYVRLSFRRNADDRQEFYNQTNARMLRQIDSLTNFVFLNTGIPSVQVLDHFQRYNIALGPAVPQMKEYVRVAIGTREDMHEFWRVWKLLPSTSHKMASISRGWSAES